MNEPSPSIKPVTNQGSNLLAGDTEEKVRMRIGYFTALPRLRQRSIDPLFIPFFILLAWVVLIQPPLSFKGNLTNLTC